MLAAALAGCNAPQVERTAEIQRFREAIGTVEKGIDFSKPLTMAQCEALAMENNLSLQTQRLALRLQDENVRLALSTGMPRATAQYGYSSRSNAAMMNQDGFVMQTEDRHTQAVNINATVPVLDFGLTYYAYQIAKDQRAQQRLLLRRSEQILRRDVRIAYARHAAALRQAKMTQMTVTAAEAVLRVAQGMEREQLATAAETAVFNAALAQARVEHSRQQQEAAETRLALAQLLGIGPGAAVTVQEAIPALPPPPTGEQVAAWEERALAARPELAVQDLERHLSANAVRREVANFFPRVDGVGSFNWSSLSTMVNPAYFVFGAQVSHSLLDGGATIWRYRLAKKTLPVEAQRALLLSLGVMYEVELRSLQLKQQRETADLQAVAEQARKEALNRILALYQEGLENEAATARAIADLNVESLAVDRAITDYLTTWYELQAAVVMEEEKAGGGEGK